MAQESIQALEAKVHRLEHELEVARERLLQRQLTTPPGDTEQQVDLNDDGDGVLHRPAKRHKIMHK
jgi:hypothetical protein